MWLNTFIYNIFLDTRIYEMQYKLINAHVYENEMMNQFADRDSLSFSWQDLQTEQNSK